MTRLRFQPYGATVADVLRKGRLSNAIMRADKLTQGLDGSLAARVASQAMPAYGQFHKDNKDNLAGYCAFRHRGPDSMMAVGGRIAGTPEGDQAISGFASMGGWGPLG